MGHRLSKIYTRTGDAGIPGLADGSRVPKDGPRIEAIGAVDELNSCLGLVLTEALDEDLRTLLTEVQHDLFDLGGELSIPGSSYIQEGHIQRLEASLDRLNAGLEPLKEFILPVGSPGATTCHLARTVCRRAEREVVALGLAHRIPGEDRTWRFRANRAPAHGPHAHFTCSRCGRTVCLEDVAVPAGVKRPRGFVPQKVELTVEGLCASSQ